MNGALTCVHSASHGRWSPNEWSVEPEEVGPISCRTRAKTKVIVEGGDYRSNEALYLLSLPIEILRDVISLSIDNLETLEPEPLLIQVLALQNVCRHFRAITRDIPQFWTFLSSTMPLAFGAQIELSKNHDLRLKLATSDIRYKRVRELFQNYSHRWRSLYVVRTKPRRSIELFMKHISALTFNNVTDLRLHYNDPLGVHGTEVLYDALATRMPNLMRLETFDHVPRSKLATPMAITSLSVTQTGNSSHGINGIASFIIAHSSIVKLRLHAPHRLMDYGRGYSTALRDPSFKDIRNLEVTLVVDGRNSLHVWGDLWLSLNYIGVSRLNIEIVSSQKEFLCDEFLWETLCKVNQGIHYDGTKFTELSISANIDFYHQCSSDDYTGKYSLPSSLRLLEMIDCSPAVINFMLPLVERLLSQQAKRGRRTLEKVVFKGRDTSHPQAEELLGTGRIEYI